MSGNWDRLQTASRHEAFEAAFEYGALLGGHISEEFGIILIGQPGDFRDQRRT